MSDLMQSALIFSAGWGAAAFVAEAFFNRDWSDAFSKSFAVFCALVMFAWMNSK